MLSDHYRGGLTERLTVIVVTADPSTERVEVVGKDAAVIQVNVGGSNMLRWPVEGEVWTVIRENGQWALEAKVRSTQDPVPVTEAQPGDLLGPDGLIPQHIERPTPGQSLVWAADGWTPATVAEEVYIGPTPPANIDQIWIDTEGEPVAPMPQRFPNFSAHPTGGALGVSSTPAKLNFQSEEWDSHTWYDAANSRFTPLVAGRYRLSVQVNMSGNTPAGARVAIYIYKNGAVYRNLSLRWIETLSNDEQHGGTCVVDANGANDYFEVWGACSSATPLNLSTASTACHFQGELIEPTGGAALPPQASVVTALPSNPIDGQEVYYRPPGGTVWHLRYGAHWGDAYKWEFLGGAAINNEVEDQSQWSNSSYIDPTTGPIGPQLTIPRPGIYDFTAACLLQPGVNIAGSSAAVAALKFGGSAVSENERFHYVGLGTATASATNTVLAFGGSTLRRTVLAANDVVKMQYKNTWATASCWNRKLQARPVRIG